MEALTTRRPATAWMDQAACAGMDPVIFFPESGAAGRAAVRQARAVCGGCPVRAECGDYQLRAEGRSGLTTRHGIWGGMTAKERNRADQEGRRTAYWMKRQERRPGR